MPKNVKKIKKKQEKELKQASRVFFARVYAVARVGETEIRISPRREREIKYRTFEAAKHAAIKDMRKIHVDQLKSWVILYATVCSRDKEALLAERQGIRVVQQNPLTWGWTAETRLGGLRH